MGHRFLLAQLIRKSSATLSLRSFSLICDLGPLMEDYYHQITAVSVREHCTAASYTLQFTLHRNSLTGNTLPMLQAIEEEEDD
jgi:hypothetical protein